jgi:hypothetical protein
MYRLSKTLNTLSMLPRDLLDVDSMTPKLKLI